MALAGRLASIVSSVLVLAILLMAGCQGQQAEAPVAKVEPARSVPAGNLGEERSKEGEKALRPSPVPTFLPSPSVAHEVTPNEIKKVQAETDKAEPSGPAVELTLRFVPGQAATYRITTEVQKSVEWKGSAASRPPKFADGRNGNHIELTFEQRVRQVQDDGAAVLEVAIKGLKYQGEVVNKVVLDFDSARPADSGSPLATLIGKSYQVKMSPKGQVLEISGVEPVRQAIQGGGPAQSVALRLLSDDEIRNRHEIATLSALKESTARPGQSWSSIRTFSFDDLGSKTYERVYTLKQTGRVDRAPKRDSSRLGTRLAPPKLVGAEIGGASPTLQTANSKDRLAVVEMKAIPSAARAAETHQGPANPFARMSDNTGSYDGRLVLDLDTGQVRECTEQMYNEWIIADPSSMQTGQPTAIKMAARRLHRLEMVQ